MTNTNTKQWTRAQYEAYAISFVDNDAIFADGKWNKVYEDNGIVWSDILHNEMYFPLPVNETLKNGVESSCSIFKSEYTDTPCEIATLDEYMPQDGDRVIWLGVGLFEFFTGEEYVVVFSTETFQVRNGKIGLKSASPSFDIPYDYSEDILVDVSKLPEKHLWGYIPRWDNAKGFNNTVMIEDVAAIDEAEDSSVVNKAVEVLTEWYGKETTHQRLIEDLVNMVSITALDGDYELSQTALTLVQQLEEELK